MNDEVSSTRVATMPLRSMRLRAGMALQTKRLVEGSTKKDSQFLAAIEGKGVMVGPVGPEGVSTGLEVGEVCIVRGFTGQYEFSFLSKVLQTFEKPFAYALLLYPKLVDARQVRQSMRIVTSIPAQLSVPGQSVLPAHEVMLIDISPAGAMVRASTPLLAVGSHVNLVFSVEFEGSPVDLNLSGVVCHSHVAASEQDGWFVGMAFTGLTRQDKLMLHYITESRPA
jgi:hypothetical protein